MGKRIILAAVLCMALAVPAAMAHGHKTKTKLDPPAYQQTGTTAADGVIFGTLVTSKEKCGDQRKVTVYRKKSGKDKKIGSTKAMAGGRAARAGTTFTFGYGVQSKHTQRGKYYTVTKPTSKCGGDRSKSATINPKSH